jgi:Na+/H+ antiporter NhaD/arsenite permease-like protein
MRIAFLTGFMAILSPSAAWGAYHKALDVHPASMAPFMVLLLTIALLPIVAGRFWHSNFRKAVVALVLSAPVVAYLYWLEQSTGEPALHRLEHSLLDYLDFIVLLAALYTVAGGVVVEGFWRPSPLLNTTLLAFGAVIGNFIGTTGASMLLIRPFLRINANRVSKKHLPVFFIFIVSNLGGLITPLGDPPLFLGFLQGVDFFWTLSLLPHWAVGAGCALLVFFICDSWAIQGEPENALTPTGEYTGLLRVRGGINFVFLGGILGTVLLLSKPVADAARAWLNQFFACPDLQFVPASKWVENFQQTGEIFPLWGGTVVLGMSLLSLLFTSRALRQANEFTWGAIIEVAVLFFGIFITMVPALEYLGRHSAELGITEPWQYFWLTGSLSSFLDNAPTYLTFATIASGGQDLGAFSMVNGQPNILLQAISVGAVFMGANTYIGNGPNFMVKAIADASGYPTPSFFGYMLYAIFILLPIFGLVTWLFFV